MIEVTPPNKVAKKMRRLGRFHTPRVSSRFGKSFSHLAKLRPSMFWSLKKKLRPG